LAMSTRRASAAKVVGLVTVIFAACFAVIVVLVLAGWATGWLNGEKVDGVVAVLKGKTETVEEAAGAKTPELALPREEEILATVRRAREAQEEQLRTLQLEAERTRLELEGVRQDARRAVAEMEGQARKLADEKKRFEAAKSAWETSLASEGLRKLKETLEEMDATKAAEMLYGYDLGTTVKVMGVIRRDGRAAILEAILAMDKQKGLTESTGRAGQIMRLLGNPAAGTAS